MTLDLSGTLHSDDAGLSWKANQRLTKNTGSSWSPAIAANNDNIYVVWQDTINGFNEIYFKRSNNGGETWTTTKRLTNRLGHSQSPAIAVNNSNIYVVWQANKSGNDEIYFKRSNNGGETWTAAKRLTNDSGSSNSPVIALDGLNIFVTWYYTSGNYQICFKRSDDGGDSWSATTRLTNNTHYSRNPAMATNEPNIYVVWDEGSPGNPSEIYLKKGLLE